MRTIGDKKIPSWGRQDPNTKRKRSCAKSRPVLPGTVRYGLSSCFINYTKRFSQKKKKKEIPCPQWESNQRQLSFQITSWKLLYCWAMEICVVSQWAHFVEHSMITTPSKEGIFSTISPLHPPPPPPSWKFQVASYLPVIFFWPLSFAPTPPPTATPSWNPFWGGRGGLG